MLVHLRKKAWRARRLQREKRQELARKAPDHDSEREQSLTLRGELQGANYSSRLERRGLHQAAVDGAGGQSASAEPTEPRRQIPRVVR